VVTEVRETTTGRRHVRVEGAPVLYYKVGKKATTKNRAAKAAADPQPAPADESVPAPQLQARRWQASHEDGAIRILVADDHQIVREKIVRILSEKSGLQVAGQAADGRDAVEKTLQLKPDVVVMDVTMPRRNGIEATRKITKISPGRRFRARLTHERDNLSGCRRPAGSNRLPRITDCRHPGDRPLRPSGMCCRPAVGLRYANRHVIRIAMA
jgi:CheY-like chemotaxis protein